MSRNPNREPITNFNTWVIGVMTAVMLACGSWFGSNILSSQKIMSEDLAALKTALPYIQSQIDQLKVEQQRLWQRNQALLATPK